MGGDTVLAHRYDDASLVHPNTAPARPTPPADREPLLGTVERVTYHNQENGFCVLRVRTASHREPVVVVGHLAAVRPGEAICASGEWHQDVQHGLQFRARHLQNTPPSNLEGIERYLGSGLIRGVGPELARRLDGAIGEQVLVVIEHHPERLLTVDGIGRKRLERVQGAWREQRAVSDIMVFLQSHGVGTGRSARIYKTYGADAVPLITENPYRLARDIRGIGFRTADELALRLGVPRDAPPRADAGLFYVLEEAATQGHCGLPRGELLERAEQQLQIGAALLEAALEAQLREVRVVAEDGVAGETIFQHRLWAAEQRVAARLTALRRAPLPYPGIDAERALDWVASRLAIQLEPGQRAAAALALAEKVVVLTGGPGVGKTTLLNAILEILARKSVAVELCAPTGRAAKRLAEATGRPARTIHRLLEVDARSGRFKRDHNSPLLTDLVVVDEASMVDVELMAALLDAVSDRSALLLCGDADQLPSVGPGQALRDVIDSGVVPVARLEQIFRQVEGSRIVRNAHRINRGQMPELETEGEAGADFFFVDARDATEAQRKIVEIVAHRIPRRFGLDPVRDVQVLCPMQRGPLGARMLNSVLQAALNPPGPAPAVERFGSTYRLGDKVMQTENDYDREVWNGDLGRIVALDPEEQTLGIQFDERVVDFSFDDLDSVVLAYATTVHKAQGSEYPAVVLPLAMMHYPMLQPNLVYTAVTRAKRLLVMVGERAALARAVRAPGARRCSLLAERLRRAAVG